MGDLSSPAETPPEASTNPSPLPDDPPSTEVIAPAPSPSDPSPSLSLSSPPPAPTSSQPVPPSTSDPSPPLSPSTPSAPPPPTSSPASPPPPSPSPLPSDSTLRARVRAILSTADLEVMTTKKVRQQLETEFQTDLTSKKQFITDLILHLMEASPAPPTPSSPPSPSSPPPEESQEELDRRLALELQSESSRPRRVAASDSFKKAAKRKSKEGGGGGEPGPKKAKKAPKLLNLSPALAEFFNGVTHMGRGDVVKQLWVYIKEHQLQSEGDKRKIVLDERLKGIFGKDRKTVDMFKMNSLLTKHLMKDEEMA